MENRSDNVISIGQAASEPGRIFWTFRYPHEVVRDLHMTAEEKRAILAAWASDEHAVESMPTLRHLPGTPVPVTFSSIMDARLQLDKSSGFQDDNPPPSPRPVRSRSSLREAA
jgi:hypothetical protein